jgi:alanine dehydrogenase
MKIGILKEIKATEQRIILVPQDAKKLIESNHHVMIETGAGEYASFRDSEYEKIGAEILPTSEKIFRNAEFIIKVQPPMPVEVDLFNENQICLSFLMATLNPDKSLALLNRKASFFASELLGKNNPVLESMNEISVDMAFTQASKYLEWQFGGKGIHLGEIKGLHSPKIMVIGAGNIGKMVVKKALSRGLEVYITDINEDNLVSIRNLYDNKSLHICPFSKKKLTNYLKKIDVLITAQVQSGQKASILLTRDEIINMEKGSVIIDLAIDHGGNLETSRPTSPDDPIYKQDDLIYYCVPNMPSALPQTSSQILSRAVLPYITKISDNNIKGAINKYEEVKSGLVFHRGKIVNQMVSENLGYEYFDINELFDLNI